MTSQNSLIRFAVHLFLLLSSAIFGAVACGCGKSPDTGEHRLFSDEFPLTLGEKKLSVRAAITELERRQGLSGCRTLPENSGMLFVYPDEDRRGFWMRGVPVGLSVGFFDASGILLETREMRANDLSVTSSRSERVKFVLEMPSGWFTRNGVSAGTPLRLDELANLLRLRGFSPENFEILSGK